MRYLSKVLRPSVFLVGALLAAATAPLHAQEASGPDAAVPAAAATSAAPAPPVGPRVREEWRPVEASFTSATESLHYRYKSSETITLNTLALVLLVVLVVVLITR